MNRKTWKIPEQALYLYLMTEQISMTKSATRQLPVPHAVSMAAVLVAFALLTSLDTLLNLRLLP